MRPVLKKPIGLYFFMFYVLCLVSRVGFHPAHFSPPPCKTLQINGIHLLIVKWLDSNFRTTCPRNYLLTEVCDYCLASSQVKCLIPLTGAVITSSHSRYQYYRYFVLPVLMYLVLCTQGNCLTTTYYIVTSRLSQTF